MLASPSKALGRRRRSLSSGLGFVDTCEESSELDANGTTGAAWQLVLKRGRQLRTRKTRDDTAEAERDANKNSANVAIQSRKEHATGVAQIPDKEKNWLRARVRRGLVPQRQGTEHAVPMCSVATQTAPSITLSHTRGRRPRLRARASTFVGAGSKSTVPPSPLATTPSRSSGPPSPSLKASSDTGHAGIIV